jgi:hypothetical protein
MYDNASQAGAHSICFVEIVDDDWLRDKLTKCRGDLERYGCPAEKIDTICQALT